MALTAAQKASVIAMAIQKHNVEDVASRYPGDEDEVRTIHAEMTDEMERKPLQPGQSWAVGSDW